MPHTLKPMSIACLRGIRSREETHPVRSIPPPVILRPLMSISNQFNLFVSPIFSRSYLIQSFEAIRLFPRPDKYLHGMRKKHKSLVLRFLPG